MINSSASLIDFRLSNFGACTEISTKRLSKSICTGTAESFLNPSNATNFDSGSMLLLPRSETLCNSCIDFEIFEKYIKIEFPLSLDSLDSIPFLSGLGIDTSLNNSAE